MNANETITAQCFVRGIIGLHERHMVNWALDTEDVNGGEWIARFTSVPGMGGADDFAQALREAVAHEESHDNPEDARPVVLLSIYDSERDQLFVGFGEHRVLLSHFSWE